MSGFYRDGIRSNMFPVIGFDINEDRLGQASELY